MALEQLNEAIEAIESQSEAIVNELLKDINSDALGIAEEVLDFAATLKKADNGMYLQSTENLRAIDSYRRRLSSYIESSEYASSVQKYATSFKGLETTMKDYFSALSVSVPKEQLYAQVTNISIENSMSALLGDGLDANFTENIFNILKNGVTAGSNRTALKTQIMDYIVGSPEAPGKLQKYADQVASDLIQQYQSNYMATIAQDLDLKYYLYKGTKIADTRSFCARIAGKVMTADVLCKFVTQQSQLAGGDGWQGMIPGTNCSNFQVNRGGYRCRHSLIPISKAVYESLKPIQFVI